MKVFMPANAGWWPRLNSEIVRSLTEGAASRPSFSVRRTSSSCFVWEMSASRFRFRIPRNFPGLRSVIGRTLLLKRLFNLRDLAGAARLPRGRLELVGDRIRDAADPFLDQQ